MRRSIQFVCHGLVFIALTLLTQVGGIAYAIALLLIHRRHADSSHWKRALSLCAATLLIYAVAIIAIIPTLAELLGRTRVPCGSTTVVGCALNRTYLKPEALSLALVMDRAMGNRFPGSKVTILEGSFPFIDGFPLLPHLSHYDGRKLDVAFFYRNASSGERISHGSPSPIGYFHFQQPRSGDVAPCAGRSTLLRWNFSWLQPAQPAWLLDDERTRAMIQWLKARPEVTRIFIEPHLAVRLGVSGGKVRFQGCQAARHDDHLHVEVR